MRDSLRVLRISGTLVLALACAPVMAQQTGDTPRPAIGMNGSELPSGGAPEPAQQSNAAAGADDGKDSNAANVSNIDAPASAAKDAPAGTQPGSAQDSNAPQFDHGAPAAGASSVVIPSADLKKAISILRRSTRDYAACTHVKTCSAYFDSFGVAFSFADGTIAAYSHEQRGQISGHDCVVKARNALSGGERSLAVQWMMAAQADILNRNWIADHPDAMLEALRTFRGWA